MPDDYYVPSLTFNYSYPQMGKAYFAPICDLSA